MQKVWAPLKLLAEAKSDENERMKAESFGSVTPWAYWPGEYVRGFMHTSDVHIFMQMLNAWLLVEFSFHFLVINSPRPMRAHGCLVQAPMGPTTAQGEAQGSPIP